MHKQNYSYGDRITGWITSGCILILCTFIFCRKILPVLNVSTAVHVTAVFDKINSLQTGEQVKTNGLPVGTIQTIQFIENKVRVGLSLAKVNILKEGLTFQVRDKSILGGKYIELIQGNGPVTDKTVFPGTLSSSISEELSGFIELFTSPGDDRTEKTSHLKDKNGLLVDFADGKGSIMDKFNQIQETFSSSGDKTTLKSLILSEDENPFRNTMKTLFQQGNILGAPGSGASTLITIISPQLLKDENKETSDALAVIYESFAFLQDIDSDNGSLPLFDGNSLLWKKFNALKKEFQDIKQEKGGLLSWIFSKESDKNNNNSSGTESAFPDILLKTDLPDQLTGGNTGFVKSFNKMLSFFTGYDPYGREKSPFVKFLQLAKTFELYKPLSQ